MRRKLFSEQPITRRKLFSSEVVEPSPQTMLAVCQDCGYKVEITGSPTATICPKCGGTRFNVDVEVYSPDIVPEKVPVKAKEFSTRRSLFSESEEDFQKTFSDTTDQFELTLKAFNGKTLTKDEFERAFSNHISAEDFEERGFGEVCENGDVKISDTAFLQSRLFSKIIVSVTKVLDLNPEITCYPNCNKGEIIDDLEQRGDLCPKGIIMIKKAHGLIPVGCNHDEEWLKDSGIMGDLKLEFGGLSKPHSDFQHTIEQRYPDAPINVLDLLKNKGIIKVSGDNVEILK